MSRDCANLSLLLDLYELTMGGSYFIYKEKTLATFDLFVRSLPAQRSYLIACGLEDVLDYLRRLRFDRDDIRYLKGLGLFSKDFLGYLSRFRFSGDVWAMPEGTVCFADEPLIRVTAPVIEAQLVESFLLNTVNLQTMIASKASRVVCAAAGRKVYDFALRRTHGAEAGLKVARSSYIAGFSGTSCVLAGKRYLIPVAGTMAHSYVMSFKEELDAFLAYAGTFPARSTLLVDTYDTVKGISHAVTAGLYLKEKGFCLQGIRLDSGDIARLSRLARRLLDKAGLKKTKIFASGNLDEFEIRKLLSRGAKVDSFGVGTNMGTSIDAPALDVIYKIAEVTDEAGAFLPTMKLSRGKVTHPGRKQVFRILGRNGAFVRDVVGLDGEKIKGLPLLRKVMDKGRCVYTPPGIERTRKFAAESLLRFPPALREVYSRYRYPVKASRRLTALQQGLSAQLAKRQSDAR